MLILPFFLLCKVWVGHPYYDVVDNRTDFERKIRRVIELICKRIGRQVGADIDDRLKAQSKKRRFLIRSLPDISVNNLWKMLGWPSQ